MKFPVVISRIEKCNGCFGALSGGSVRVSSDRGAAASGAARWGPKGADSSVADPGGWQISFNPSLPGRGPLGIGCDADSQKALYYRLRLECFFVGNVSHRTVTVYVAPRRSGAAGSEGANSIGNYINSAQTNTNVLFVQFWVPTVLSAPEAFSRCHCSWRNPRNIHYPFTNQWNRWLRTSRTNRQMKMDLLK